MTYRSEHYRIAARALPCTLQIVRCSGPAFLVHNDMLALGKGRGTKSADVGAAGCDACHRALADLPRNDQHYYTMRGTIRTVVYFLENDWLDWTVSLEQLQKEVRARVA